MLSSVVVASLLSSIVVQTPRPVVPVEPETGCLVVRQVSEAIGYLELNYVPHSRIWFAGNMRSVELLSARLMQYVVPKFEAKFGEYSKQLESLNSAIAVLPDNVVLNKEQIGSLDNEIWNLGYVLDELAGGLGCDKT
jgi:hypothetical protein